MSAYNLLIDGTKLGPRIVPGDDAEWAAIESLRNTATIASDHTKRVRSPEIGSLMHAEPWPTTASGT
jgi:hypothetical protein